MAGLFRRPPQPQQRVRRVPLLSAVATNAQAELASGAGAASNANAAVAPRARRARGSGTASSTFSRANTFDAGADGTDITVGNSGGANGDAFDLVDSSAPQPKYETGSPTPLRGAGAALFVDDVGTSFLQWSYSDTVAYLRAYLFLLSTPAAGTFASLLVTEGGALRVFIDDQRRLGILAVSLEDLNNVIGVEQIPLTTWVRIEAKAFVTGASEVRLFLDPDEETTPDEVLIYQGGGDLTDLGITLVEFGDMMELAPDLDFAFDDIAVTPTGWIGIGSGRTSMVTLKPNAGHASGSGAAHNPTPVAVTSANAGVAAGTGAAANATPSLASNASNAGGSGSAGGITSKVSPGPTAALGTGAASNAGGTASLNGGHAAGTGSAGQAAANIRPNAANSAGTGAAYGLSASIATASNVAQGTGASGGPSSSVATSGGAASGTGSAHNATGAVAKDALAGAATGSGQASTAAASVAANAGAATGTGAAFNATPTAATNAAPTAATGAGAAGLAAANIQPNANVGAGSGAAQGATASLAGSAGAAGGTGAAGGPSSSVAASAIAAGGTGAAFDATVSTAADTSANAGLASGDGVASDGSVSLAATAGHASGTGAAYNALIPVPVWTTPADTDPIDSLPELKFTTPLVIASAMHFNIWLDKVTSFDSGDFVSIASDDDQTGWDYWNGSAWTAVPSGGVPPEYAGNEIRYTVQSPLAGGTWYRKVRVGI